jgi:hypothetical protein
MSSRSFKVKFKNSNTEENFQMTDSMMKFLVKLSSESDDNSDLEFSLNSKVIDLKQLIESKSFSSPIEMICKFIEFLSNPAANPMINENQFDPDMIWQSPIRSSDVGVYYGYPHLIGKPKENQGNARWVMFKIRRSKNTSSQNTSDTIWIKQRSDSQFDFSKMISKWMRVVGVVHDMWMINVLQIISDNKLIYLAAGL